MATTAILGTITQASSTSYTISIARLAAGTGVDKTGVQYATSATGTWTSYTSAFFTTVGSSITVTGLTANTTYFFRGVGYTSINTVVSGTESTVPGMVDTTFTPNPTIVANTTTNPNPSIRAILMRPDGKFLVGGVTDFRYTLSSGPLANKLRYALACVDTNGSFDSSFIGDPSGGGVGAIAMLPNGNYLIGGGFQTFNGYPTPNLVCVDASGNLVSGFEQGSGAISTSSNTVNRILVQPDGKILVAGLFTTFKGTTNIRRLIARLNANGTLDTTFTTGTGTVGFMSGTTQASIDRMALDSNNKIVIGGTFSSYGGVARNGLARIDASGNLDTAFVPEGGGPNLNTNGLLIQSDGKIIVAGSFTQFGTSACVRIARVDASGNLDPSFNALGSGYGAGADANIAELLGEPDGKILICGNFTTYNGVARHRVARLYANGTLDPTPIHLSSFSPNSSVRMIIPLRSDAKLLIAGDYNNYGGNSYAYLTRIFDTTKAPDAPTFASPALIASNSSIQVRWAAPASNGVAISDYTVQYKVASAADSTYTSYSVGASQLNYTVTDLSDNVTYAFRVRATNSVGSSDWSAVQTGQTVTAPSAPQNFAASALNGTVTLTWAAPASTGGDPIDGYKLTYGADGGSMNPYPESGILGPTVTTATISGLTSSTAYNFSIVAYNGVDPSDGAAATTTVTQYGPVSAPQTPTLTAGIRQITVSWSSTALNGNTVVTYKIYYRAVGATSWSDPPISTTSTSTTISGLENGTAYEVEVSATGNRDTTESAWVAATPVTTAALPVLSDGVVTIGSKRLTLTWSKVSDANYPITWYGINRDGTNISGPAASATSFTNTGLTDGRKYTYNLLATSAVGTSNTLTLSGIPYSEMDTAGVIDTAFNTRDANGGDLSFSPATPVFGNRSVLTTLPLADGKVFVGGSFSYLNNGATKFLLARLNANGSVDTTFDIDISGAATNSCVAAIEPLSNGNYLIGGIFTTVNGQAAATFACIDSSGNLVSGFQHGANPTVTGGYSVGKFIVQPDGKILLCGCFDAFRGVTRRHIARINADGSTDTTFSSGTNTVTAITTSTIASISTMALDSNNKIVIGGDFTSYRGITRNALARIDASGNLDTTFVPQGTGPNLNVNRLVVLPDDSVVIAGSFTQFNSVSTPYIARVDASGNLDTSFNTGGVGPNSSLVELVRESDGKFLIGGNFITYNGLSRVRIARLKEDGSLDATLTSGAGPNNSVRGITPLRSNAKLLVYGDFNTYNGGGFARLARIFDPKAPDAPTFASPALVAGDTNINVRWSAPASNGATVLDYTVQYKVASADDSTYITRTAVTQLNDNVTDLSDNVTYAFRVRARNSVGSSSWSTIQTGQTVTIPTKPRDFVAVADDNQVTLSWTDPSDNGGDPIDGYKLSYGPAGGLMTLYGGTLTPSGTIITGLDNGTTYDFSIVAYNGVDPSDGAAAFASATPLGPAITNISVNETSYDPYADPPTVTLEFSFDQVPGATGYRLLDAYQNEIFSSSAWPLQYVTQAYSTLSCYVVAYNVDNNTSTQIQSAPLTITIACLPRGTRILTPTGFRLVEEIATGDLITTEDGREVLARIHRSSTVHSDAKSAPVRIAARSFFGEYPVAPIRVSSWHAFKVGPGNAWMVPKDVLDVDGVVQEPFGQAVEYYHFELPDYLRDNLVLEGGAVVESYGIPWKQAAGLWGKPTYIMDKEAGYCRRIEQ